MQAELRQLSSAPAASADAAWAEEAYQYWLGLPERATDLELNAARAYMAAHTARENLAEQAACTASTLVKARQTEHHLHFLEERSELGFGLWHEVCRKFWRRHQEWLAARESANLVDMNAAWSGWKQDRRDYCVLMWRSGCLVGTCFSAYILTWRFKA